MSDMLICYKNLHVFRRSELADHYSKALKIWIKNKACPICGKTTMFG
jgi:hypothetical protein